MLTDLKATLRPALMLTLLFALLLGLGYPLAITGIAQLILPAQANGSLIRDAAGHVRGSTLIAQGFAGTGYLHPRPSAAGKGYDPLASGGSNFAPTSKALADRVRADIKALPGSPGVVPPDLVTTSASGLDPDLSPEAALSQAPRIARARGIAPDRVEALIRQQTEHPLLGIIGEERVNVLKFNQALDQLGHAAP